MIADLSLASCRDIISKNYFNLFLALIFKLGKLGDDLCVLMLSFRLRTMTKHVLKCEMAGYYLFIIGYRAALTTLLEAVTARKVPAEAADPDSVVTPPQARGTLAVAEVEVHLSICCYRRSQKYTNVT